MSPAIAKPGEGAALGLKDDRLRWRGTAPSVRRGFGRAWREGAGAILLCTLAWSAGPFIPTGLGAAWIAVATLVLAGALSRITVSADRAGAAALGLGPWGLQFGRTEARLLAAFALCAVFMARILSVVALVLLALFGLSGLDPEAIRAREWETVGPAWKLVLLGAVTAAGLYVVVALTARLSLFAPATAAERRVVSLQTIALSRGAFWSLLAGLLVTAAPSLVVVLATGLGWARGDAAWIFWAMILNGVQAPLTLAYLGTVYRRLQPTSPRETAHG